MSSPRPLPSHVSHSLGRIAPKALPAASCVFGTTLTIYALNLPQTHPFRRASTATAATRKGQCAQTLLRMAFLPAHQSC